MSSQLKAGRYQVEQEIGRGGMGVVYRARDTKLGRTVALKMVPLGVHGDLRLRERLAREARAASAVSHPGIATVHDFVEEGGESFIVYEYIEGITLRGRLREQRFTTGEVLDIGIQAADALAAAHEHGLTHRDMKPENILLAPAAKSPGRVKILDFGLAKIRPPMHPDQGNQTSTADVETLTSTGTALVGTIGYMSPEQLQGQPVDERADIYSLGLVIYEMLTGTNPFLGSTATSTIANILTKDAVSLATLNPVAPPELDRIVQKCLRKQPEERYQSARELLADLSALRRDLTRHSEVAGVVGTTRSHQAQPRMSRSLARALFLVIQFWYIAMYLAAAYYLPSHLERLLMFFPTLDLLPIAIFMGLSGAAVRLYFLFAVALDYADWGRAFRRLFPLIVLLDEAWAASPLLLFEELGAFVWPFVILLVYLPFFQRTLLISAYTPGESIGRP